MKCLTNIENVLQNNWEKTGYHQQFRHLMDFTDRLNQFYIECKVMELLIMMLNQMETNDTASPIKLSACDIGYLYQAKDLLQDFEQTPSLKEISRKAGVNEFKLNKGFSYLFGDSLFGCRHSVRMEKSRIILLETKLPIHDIVLMTGFEYPENFYKALKKYWGYMLAELRRSK